MIKDSGSNYSFGDKTPKASVGKSKFDLSYVNSFTCDEAQLVPCCTEFTLLGDSFQMSEKALIRVVNTPVVPLASRQRAFTHTYWSSLPSLWKDAQSFFAKGYTTSDYQDLSKDVIPYMKIKGSDLGRGSLADMLGYNFVNLDSDTYYEVQPFLFMMYLRVMRDVYINKRIYKTWLDETSESSGDEYDLISKFMFPRDDGDFRIGSAQYKAIFEWEDSPSTAQANAVHMLVGEIWYRDWSQDYFTTALPTPVIVNAEADIVKTYAKPDQTVTGDFVSDSHTTFGPYAKLKSGEWHNLAEAQLNDNLRYGGKGSNFKVPPNVPDLGAQSSYFDSAMQMSHDDSVKFFTDKSGNVYSSFFPYGAMDADFTSGTAGIRSFTTKHADDLAFFNSMIGLSGSLTMDALRNLACASAILEKAAKIDGSYKQFGLSYFGISPSSAQTFTPKYIGGTYAPIIFTDVIDTGNNLGQIAGKGISGSDGYIGNFFSDDYGIVMTLFSIIPDTYYSQGLRKQLSYKTSDEFYLPERARLGMSAILNKEIYNDVSNVYGSNEVFGYQNRFDEYRYRANEVHGKVADSSSESFHPFIEQRQFSSCPTLTPSFLNMKGTVDAEWKSVSDEVGYFVQILNDNKAIRPIPYMAEENNMGF